MARREGKTGGGYGQEGNSRIGKNNKEPWKIDRLKVIAKKLEQKLNLLVDV